MKLFKSITISLLAIIASFFLVYSSSNAQIYEEETFVSLGKTSTYQSAVSVESIEDRDQLRYAKVVVIYNALQKDLVKNELVAGFVRFTRYDCQNKKIQFAERQYFDNKMKVVGVNTNLEPWLLINILEKDSVGVLEFDTICKVKIPKQNTISFLML